MKLLKHWTYIDFKTLLFLHLFKFRLKYNKTGFLRVEIHVRLQLYLSVSKNITLSVKNSNKLWQLFLGWRNVWEKSKESVGLEDML